MPRPIPRDPPVTSACLPLSDIVSSFPRAIAAMTRPMSSTVWTCSLRPVRTRSTTPRSPPAPASVILTMNVMPFSVGSIDAAGVYLPMGTFSKRPAPGI
jgi:hypothetical protein